MKCICCSNDCYRTDIDKTGCADGKDCAHEEYERMKVKFIKGETENKGEIIFSVSKCTEIDMQYRINRVLRDKNKVFVNGVTLKGFELCLVSTDQMEIVFSGDGISSVIIPFEYNTNVRVDYKGQDIEIVMEAL